MDQLYPKRVWRLFSMQDKNRYWIAVLALQVVPVILRICLERCFSFLVIPNFGRRQTMWCFNAFVISTT
jgi:hypothetical protein